MSQLGIFGIDATSVSTEEGYLIRFCIPTTLSVFEGHFPGAPILPAFASIEISLAIGRDLKLFGDKIKKISSAKFLAALKPGEKVEVKVVQDKISTDFQWFYESSGERKKACEISVVVGSQA